jgi:prepilin-type N-terminal cleavage/methylation domain-containing protein
VSSFVPFVALTLSFVFSCVSCVLASVKGFSLIEVVVVMALIALTLTLAGPRIGAGLGRLELERSRNSIRNFIKIGRVQAERADQEYYVVIDRKQESVKLLDPEMKMIRQELLPSTIQIDLGSNVDIAGLTISPSGIVRGSPIRLHGRTGELIVDLQ